MKTNKHQALLSVKTKEAVRAKRVGTGEIAGLTLTERTGWIGASTQVKKQELLIGVMIYYRAIKRTRPSQDDHPAH